MDKPFFSIIIPTLNEEKFLPGILHDLQAQKEKNFEVIVVDGDSEDKTKNVAVNNCNIPIKFFEVKKRNVSYQRNFGAKKAEGKYLVFLDADSGVSKGFTKQLKMLILRKRGLIFLPYITPDEDSSQLEIIFKLANFLIEFSQNLNKPFSAGGSIIIEKNLFQQLDGFDEKLYLAEDHDLIHKTSQWGVKAKFLPQIKIKFSLRRMKKEGELKVFYKFLLSTIHLLFKGKIKEKIFDYKMGGGEYKQLQDVSINGNVKDYLRQIRRFFRRYLA